jgi:hypothetical protein
LTSELTLRRCFTFSSSANLQTERKASALGRAPSLNVSARAKADYVVSRGTARLPD